MAIDRNERAARYQSLFREVNERVVELEQDGLQEIVGADGLAYAVCECANAACHEEIELGMADYEAVRASPIRFFIKAGHEWPDVEHVVAEHDGYVVVEKLGETGEIATALARPRLEGAP
jgi:hypothetical protein